MKRSVIKWLLSIILIFILVVSIVVLSLSLKDYSRYFQAQRGKLNYISLQVYEQNVSIQKSWLTLVSTSGFKVQAGLLAPRDSSKHHPAIILLGGKATGRYAIDYALDIDNVVILALDYPYEPRESYSFLTVLSDVPAVRKALIDMVPAAMLATDYLFRRNDVDSNKLVILGYSFGAPFVPAIVAHDHRSAAAIMVCGGGGLASMIRHNVRRYEGVLMSEFVARLGELLLNPLEPMEYADKISPTPVVMINGIDDEQVPRYNTELFFNAAREPKKIVWLESKHVRPDNVELTRRIIATIKVELKRMKVLSSEF